MREIKYAMATFRIKEVCKEKGITLAVLAERMGVTPSAVTQFQKADNISSATLIKIADILGVSLDDLVVRDGGSIDGYVNVNGKIHHITKKEDLENLIQSL